MPVRLSEYRPVYKEALTSPVLDVGETFQDILSLTTPSLDPGLYVVIVSFVWGFPTTAQSMEVQYTGDFPSPVFRREFKDISEIGDFAYAFTADLAAPQTLTVTHQVRKDGGPQSLDVLDANLVIQRIF